MFGSTLLPAHASFTSFYIFGDSVSTTTNYTGGGTNYYGERYSNGRVWVELFAQQLGFTNNYWYSTNSVFPVYYTNLYASSTNWSYSSNNWSYFGDYSSNMVANVSAFQPPPDSNTALFAIWVSSADLYGTASSAYFAGTITNMAVWTNAINSSQSNHFVAITNLYAKGARTLIMPNAVDVTVAPFFSFLTPANKSFVHQRVIDYNAAFAITVSNAIAALPGVTIYVPDFFTLFNNVFANPAAYGLTNAGIGVLQDTSLKNKSLNGPGTNYIFWDQLNPSAKFHATMAGVAQQTLSQPQISKLTLLGGSNRLDLVNVPVGLDGLVYGCADLVNWSVAQNIDSTNVSLSIFLPPNGPLQFYRLFFPFTWTWP